MRIIDENWNEVTDPDTEAGYLSEPMPFPKPGAYDTIDNETKFALDDDDYEIAQVYYRYTDEELADIKRREQEAAERQTLEETIKRQPEINETIFDGVAELGGMVVDNSVTIDDIMEAVAELGAIVAEKMEA